MLYAFYLVTTPTPQTPNQQYRSVEPIINPSDNTGNSGGGCSC